MDQFSTNKANMRWCEAYIRAWKQNMNKQQGIAPSNAMPCVFECVGSILFSHIFNGTEILIPMPKIPVCQIQVGVFCDRNTTVSQDPTEGVDIHTIHQTPLCKVIPQRVWGVGLINTSPSQIPLKPGFKGMDFQRKPGFLREQQFTIGIPILVAQPPLQTFGSFYSPILIARASTPFVLRCTALPGTT